MHESIVVIHSFHKIHVLRFNLDQRSQIGQIVRLRRLPYLRSGMVDDANTSPKQRT